MLILLQNAKFELLFLILLKYFNKISNKLFFIVLLFLIYFFRSPTIQYNKGIVSPTFGKVLDIIKNKDETIFQIFLNINDPHIQYFPCHGKVLKQIYIKGSFHPAYFLKKSKHNERMITLLDTHDNGIIKIIQYGGMLVRRIVSFVEPPTNVVKNQMLGMIKFSSRVDIHIPHSQYKNINVNIGDYVKGGDTLMF